MYTDRKQSKHGIIPAFAIAMALALAILVSIQSYASASTFAGCGYYVIMGCSKNETAIRQQAGNGYLAVRTDDYPNFRNGWYCVAEGPFVKRSSANTFRDQVRGVIPDAYVKSGC